jgi:cytochrome c biogenesis protein CcmG/thiol:disulfide interchange protein DsbE
VRHPLRWIALTVAVFVVAFGVVLATQVGGDPNEADSKTALLGDVVPIFSVERLDGTTLTQSDLDGRAVIINFWNSWCIPCEQELPALKTFYERHADDDDFLMLGIVRDDTEAAVRAHVSSEDLDWVIALDPDSLATLAFGTRGQPETFAISPSGRIVGFQSGPSTVGVLERMLDAARVAR